MRFIGVTAVSVLVLSLLSVGVMTAGESESDAVNEAIVSKYIDATHTQQEALRGAQMEVDIEANLPKLSKRGTLRALRHISKIGQITYKALGFSGDNTVKNEVITRYLAAETEGRNDGSMAISPQNYRFKYKGRRVQDGRLVDMLEISPRKKAIGLFKGELWVDSETGMPMRESGEFVKTPSVFLKKIAFVRAYELHDGVAFPSHIESTVDTRVIGRAELAISFSHFSKEDAEELLDSAVSGQANQ